MNHQFRGLNSPVEKIPSTDRRFETVGGDIHQHRVNNFDWPDDWVFYDNRFELHHSDEKLLRFLAETLHPVVQRDPQKVAILVGELNKRLQLDGWELAEAETISGRPCYAAQRVRSGAVMAVTRARVAADVLEAGWMKHEITRMEKAIHTDPSLAIGTAKEVVETCCKTILTRRGQVPPKGADIPMLVKLTAKELNLIPDGIPDAAKGADVIRMILRSLATMTQGLAELRGLYGTGHGRDGKHRGLQPRHARLAVAASIAFVDFVAETYREREDQQPKLLAASVASAATPVK
ncbi:MAG: abortive infection family protein [Acidobacteria bacterium]|nr:abortive infection family protein [Acidobacteriota bacterium]